MNPINFELSKTISYANGTGSPIECSHIELREPTGKVSHICCAIEGLIQSSLLQMSDHLDAGMLEEAKEAAAQPNLEGDDDGGEKDGDAVLALMVSGGADMNKLVLHFRELFKQVAWMGGEKQITSARMDDMSHADFRKMIGVYAANFILS
jgi:hypothetical protein